MMFEPKFLRCRTCGRLVMALPGVENADCCGESTAELLTANTTDAAQEKHADDENDDPQPSDHSAPRQIQLIPVAQDRNKGMPWGLAGFFEDKKLTDSLYSPADDRENND